MCEREGCKYASGHFGEICDFLSKTGKSRQKLIADTLKLPNTHPKVLRKLEGRNCPFYEKRSEEDPPLQSVLAECRFSPAKRQRKTRLPPLPEDDLMEAYRAGLTDPEIAEKLGLGIHRVCKWRQARKLPSNYQGNIKANETLMRQAYDRGLNDQQISRETGISAVTVQKWRAKNHLPAINRKSTKGRDQELRELYHRGLNDTQLAQAAGLTRMSVKGWRERNGLTSNWKQKTGEKT